MPMPQEYFLAARDFDSFLVDAMQALDLTTRHQTWQVLIAVFDTFRRRLTCEQGVRFANALPPLLRAAFIDGWDPGIEPLAFGDHRGHLSAVQAFRRDHNLAPDHCIETLGVVLRRHVGHDRLDALLAQLPAGAAPFWAARDS